MENHIIVSQDGNGDYTTISEAIENAEVGTKIYVKPGSYEEHLKINKDIELIGDVDNKPQVYVETGSVCTIESDAKISNFEFFNTDYSTPEESNECEQFYILDICGNAEINNCIVRQCESVGIGLVGTDFRPIINGCSVSECNLAGIYTINNSIIKNCDVQNCYNANFIAMGEATPLIENCKIHNGNTAGLSLVENTKAKVLNCELYNNAQPNIIIMEEANPTVENCNIHQGEDSGLVVIEEATGTYSNCLIYENKESNIVTTGDTNPIIENCKIYNSECYGIWMRENATGTYKNCDIYENKLSNIFVDDESNPSIIDCDIHDSYEYGIKVSDTASGTYKGCNTHDNAYYLDDNFDIQNGILMNYFGGEEHVHIPLFVTKIDENVFPGHLEIKTVTLEENITTIGDNAFGDCINLESINFPSSITTIKDNAFSGCTSLQSITLPSSISQIGDGAFNWCESIKTFTIPENITSIGTMLLAGCTSLEKVSIPDCVTNIGQEAFAYCENLKTIKLPSSLSNLGDEAFNRCSSLESISLPEGITMIGEGTFKDCEKLKTVNLPHNLTSIDSDAFTNCESLETINISEKVSKIDIDAFNNCSNLKEINIDENNKEYSSKNGVLYNKECTKVLIVPCGLETVELQSNVETIEISAFKDCKKLQTVNVPEGVVSIDEEAFLGCSNLRSITLPKTLNKLYDNVFKGCDNLTSITIDPDNEFFISKNGIIYNKECTTVIAVPCSFETVEIESGVTTIGDNAFSSSGTLKKVILPSTVTTIGYGAFSTCTSLEKIEIPFGVTTIGEKSFNNCSSLKEITLPDSIKTIGCSAFENCYGLETILLPLGIKGISTQCFSGCSNLKTISLPSSITDIYKMAFQNCLSLETIEIPNTVTNIGEQAFYKCINLKSISLPNSLTSIGECAFEECTSFEEIHIPSNIKTIGKGAFSDCENLQTIVLPDTLKEIKDDPFDYYENNLVIDLTKYNPYQFDLETRNKLISSNISYLMDNMNLKEENCRAWMNYFRSNVDIYYEDIARDELLRQFMFKYNLLLLEDVWELENLATFNYRQDLVDIFNEYEKDHFGNESDPSTYRTDFRLVQLENEDFLTLVKYKGLDENIEVPESVNGIRVGRIGEYAFSPMQEGIDSDEAMNRRDINSISIPSSVHKICKGAFKGCISISNLEMPNNENILDEEDFEEISYELTNLESFIIPEGITKIGDSAFSNFINLRCISIPSTVNFIGSNIFYDSNEIENINISENNKNYYMKDGVLYNKDDIAIYYPKWKKEDCEFDASVLTDTPVPYVKSKEEIFGSDNGKYVLFGDWPQTIKQDDVTIDEKHRYNINGWECYKGSDDCYYIKSVAYPFTDNNIFDPTFSNGKKIKSGFVYYFKLEGIKWRILDNNYGGGKLLVSEYALTSDYYHRNIVDSRYIDNNEIKPNNYEYSQIRAYLNGLDGSSYDVDDFTNNGFLNKAFSKNAQAKIKTVNIDNSFDSTKGKDENIIAPNLVYNNTNDKVFLLSRKEISKKEYGFMDSPFAKIRKITDYSKAKGTDYDYINNTNWLLRSPYSDSGLYARYISCTANINEFCLVLNNCYGIVPAISIQF